MEYETVIGLEVHVQLRTQSKMFCSCRADYQSAPVNSRVCPVCLGLPGALPVINRRAVEYTVMTGLALNCDIPRLTKFDRKNYPYPDLMKGYQISQYDLPLAIDGRLQIETEAETKAVGVTRVHLEEDVAKLQHFPADSGGYSLVDVNRSGVPLMEIVSEPDMRSAEEARAYLTTLHSLLQYLGVSTANMQDGSFRCDANISLRPAGSEEFGNRTEIKNMNSFRSVFQALNFEIERQRRVLEGGGRVVQETRGWIEGRAVTVSQRSKEDAHDYRYFPEPDLPPLDIDPVWVEEIRGRLPELATQRCARFQQDYGLSEYDARLLTDSKAMADYFETAVCLQALSGDALNSHAKQVSNWMLGDLSGLLNQDNRDISESPVSPESLVELIGLVGDGIISVTMGKTVLEEAYNTGGKPRRIVEERGYTQISDTSAVEPAVFEALEANPRAVADYLGGKESAAKFLVGQVMKITRGQAKPDLVNQLVTAALDRAKAGVD
ncbi:Aspartyl/glutamyl-tRNA(Asn/Gln) amidotransferase subunit B [Geodia barretti]|uniref:Glutamyl-tRNA(Gln) amidotransferase subunit B, mitochondrial n=1 Tax=Geodia barretti TaxID=519541 RepID=A0AA35SR49_GEOBA|nr:Aspartyl/glutamyl-tRNA(Asn/Gln) amidotransferase subunit B [Geodia barretti]